MAQIQLNEEIYLDGILLKDAAYDLTIDSTDLDYIAREYLPTGRPNIKVRIKGPRYTIELNPDAYEREMYEGRTIIRIYGILPKLMPELYKDRLLLDWQLAYLRVRKDYTIIDEFKYYRDDIIFTTIDAFWFEKGWNAHDK